MQTHGGFLKPCRILLFCAQLMVGLPWPQHHAVLHNPWMLDNITLTMQAAVQASNVEEAGRGCAAACRLPLCLRRQYIKRPCLPACHLSVADHAGCPQIAHQIGPLTSLASRPMRFIGHCRCTT